MGSSKEKPIKTTESTSKSDGISEISDDKFFVSSDRPQVPKIPDGRSLRATGRTHQFSTRIKLETHDKMKYLAFHQRITLGELLERMLDAYERESQLTTEKNHQA